MIEAIPFVDEWTFAGLTALSVLTSAIGVAAGLGGGVLMIAVMATIFPPAALIALHGTIQFGTNITRIALMRRYVLVSAIAPFGIGALIGGLAGGQLVVSLPPALLQAVLGGFLLYVCWAPRITAGAPTRTRFFVLGAIGTLISMFVGATGTLLAPFVVGVSPDRLRYVATIAAIMSLTHGLKVIIFGVLGFTYGPYLPLLAAMIAASFVGNWIGRHVLEKTPEALFRRVFQAVLTLLSLRLLYSAASEAGLFT